MGKHLYKISKYKPSALQGTFDFSPVAQLSFGGEHSLERMALRMLGVVLIALACTYLYFVTASVLHVMDRREALAKITDMQGSIGTLEQSYFALSHEITPQMAGDLGLSSVKKTSYIYRSGTIGAVTMASHEI